MHPGNYNTSLAVQYTSCNPDLSNIIKLGTPDAGLYTNLIGVQDDTLNPATALIFTGICSGAPTTFSWKFGDGKDTTTSSSTVTHNYPSPGIYTITLTTIDSAGYTAVYNENIVTSGYSESCEVNYYESFTPQANPDSLSNVTIVYTSGNGTVYNSNNSLQPTGSYFKITSVSPYQNNTSNQATKMLNVTFSCLLYPSTGSPIPASGTAVIAVAYH
jgi:PKD repeat protein